MIFLTGELKWENVTIRIVNVKTANVAKIVNAEKMVKNANAGKNVLAAIIANTPKKINVVKLAIAGIINRK